MEFPRRRFLQLTGAAAFAPLARAARADTYPSRVVKLVVGFPPGGGADLAARIVATRLSEIWPQQVIVENRPGAGARIALDAVAHAAPDGYTMLLAPGSPLVQALLFSKLTFDPAADFAPVSLVGTYPDIIAVPNSSPFQTLQEFTAHAKANPGKISWASPGVGTVPHLAGELFKRRAGIEMTHVPYRGVTEGLMADFIAGRLDLMFNTTGSLLQPVRSKQVRGAGDHHHHAVSKRAGNSHRRRIRGAWLRRVVVVRALCAGEDAAGHRQENQRRRRCHAARAGHAGEIRAARRFGGKLDAGGACRQEHCRRGALGTDHQGS